MLNFLYEFFEDCQLNQFYSYYHAITEGLFNNISNSNLYYYATDYTIFFSVKLILCLLFLILIRGGVPRYRYDFLTKIGWVKFLGYVLTIFLISVVLFLVW